MKTILLLHLLPFLHSAPEPDTHLHVHLPPENGQGNSFLVASFSSVSSKGENPTPVEGRLEQIMVKGLERLMVEGRMVEGLPMVEGLIMNWGEFIVVK